MMVNPKEILTTDYTSVENWCEANRYKTKTNLSRLSIYLHLAQQFGKAGSVLELTLFSHRPSSNNIVDFTFPFQIPKSSRFAIIANKLLQTGQYI